MIRLTMVAGAALALAACTPGGSGTHSAGSNAPAAGETIRYETGRCFGTCPVYSVTVRPDGTGSFEGKQFTAVTGSRTFTLTPAQYRAFADRLAPYRPAQGERRYEPGSALCPNHATDMSSADVTWSGAGGTRHLYYYYGCAMGEGQDMRTAVRTAPELLPIGEFIGERAVGR